jgi:TRAP-type C4-dicarboxylate transport system permease small subunit
LKVFQKTMSFFEALTAYMAAFLMAALSVIVFLGVFSRYALHNPWQWTEEAARIAFIWVVFLGASVGVRRGLHFRFTLLLDAMGPGVRRWMEILANLWVAFFAGIMVVKGLSFTMMNMGQLTPTMMIPKGWVYVAVPINGLLMIFYCVEHVMKLVTTPAEALASLTGGHQGEEVQA